MVHIRYLGGKSRIRRDIAEYINANSDENSPFVSLFCGSCAVESLINAKRKICNDAHPYIIAMWRELQRGRKFPEKITDKEYHSIKENMTADSALAGFVGFGCSYGGKWWGGLARDRRGDDFCKAPKISIAGLENAEFICNDYCKVIIPPNSTVYCDPPYKATTGYSTGVFDNEAFWEYMRIISKDNNVFISEENAPEDFVCVWQKPLRRQIDNQGKNVFVRTEKLFTLRK